MKRVSHNKPNSMTNYVTGVEERVELGARHTARVNSSHKQKLQKRARRLNRA